MRIEQRLLPASVALGGHVRPPVSKKARRVLDIRQLPDHPAQQTFSLTLPSGKTIPIRHGQSLFYNHGPSPKALARAVDQYLHDHKQTVDEVEIWPENFLAFITRHDQFTEQPGKCLFIPQILLQSDARLYAEDPRKVRFSRIADFQPAGLLSPDHLTETLRRLLSSGAARGSDHRKTEIYIQCWLAFHGLDQESPGRLFGITELGEKHNITPERPRQIVISCNHRMKQAVKWQFNPIKARVDIVLARLLRERYFLTAPEVAQALIEAGLAEEKERSFIFPLLMLLDYLYISNAYSNAYSRALGRSKPDCPDARTYLDLGSQPARLLLDKSFFERQRRGSLSLVEPVLFPSHDQYQTLESFPHDLVRSESRRCWPIAELQQRLAEKLGVWVPRSRLELIYGARGYPSTADDFLVYGELDAPKIIAERIDLLLQQQSSLTAREIAASLDLPLSRVRTALTDRTRFDLGAGDKYSLRLP